jgi:PAS domain S-box-containing protein
MFRNIVNHNAMKKGGRCRMKGVEKTKEQLIEELNDCHRRVIELEGAETKYRQAEEQLRRLSAIVESSDDAIISESLDGTILSWNEAAKRIYGYTFEEVKGHPISILMPPDRFNEIQPILARIKSGERVANYETVFMRKDGQQIHISLTISPIKDAEGRVMGASAIGRDITERRKMEEMLREQQRVFMEVSVPVVNIWKRILLVPLIGIFDSKRAQLVMETLLTAIEETQAKVAILDISGIPVMDTFVAKHLLQTVSAARLMGTECIITGISSIISRTIVKLGVDLAGVVTKTTLAEGLRLAFDLTNLQVVVK